MMRLHVTVKDANSRSVFICTRLAGVCVIFLTIICCHYCVASENAGNSGALTLVPGQDSVDNDDGVEIADEESESRGDHEQSDPNMEVFYPTKEWQNVKKGQAIPAGLHVRLNLETGSREAKLMDGDDGMKYWKQGDRQGMVNAKNKFFSRDELKKALKDFKAQADDEETTRRREASIKKKFKSYQDLKREFQAMNMDIKTDLEIITALVNRLRHPDIDDEDKVFILTDLEYHLHQVDNALLFSDMGGMSILVKALNGTNKLVKSGAAFVIGSAAQSNPKVQVQAVEEGVLEPMVRLLSTETLLDIRKRLMYAISSVIRQFPFAQQRFLHLGGLAVLSGFFTQTGTEKLRLKAVTLLNDLLIEKELIKEMDPEDSVIKDKMVQYDSIPLLESMLEYGWCELIPTLLISAEHDTREKVLSAMTTLQGPCRSSFVQSRTVLEQLRTEYQQLADDEQKESLEDRYFTHLLETVDSVMVFVGQKDEL